MEFAQEQLRFWTTAREDSRIRSLVNHFLYILHNIRVTFLVVHSSPLSRFIDGHCLVQRTRSLYLFFDRNSRPDWRKAERRQERRQERPSFSDIPFIPFCFTIITFVTEITSTAFIEWCWWLTFLSSIWITIDWLRHQPSLSELVSRLRGHVWTWSLFLETVKIVNKKETSVTKLRRLPLQTYPDQSHCEVNSQASLPLKSILQNYNHLLIQFPLEKTTFTTSFSVAID